MALVHRWMAVTAALILLMAGCAHRPAFAAAPIAVDRVQ
jgi:hypothetical protein